ncbi:MAG: hypothetical protein EA411_11970 [Saprospirales bacterium]|nr:MAG: hypothetical protein EA411_11970 [Saprospirales bacterium]
MKSLLNHFLTTISVLALLGLGNTEAIGNPAQGTENDAAFTKKMLLQGMEVAIDPVIKVDTTVVVSPQTFEETVYIRTSILGWQVTENGKDLVVNFYIHTKKGHPDKIKSIARDFRARAVESGLIESGKAATIKLDGNNLLVNGSDAARSDHRSLWRSYNNEYRDLNEIWLSVE